VQNANVNITLPDGSVRAFDKPVSGLELATDIGPGLAKAALALRIDGEMRDLKTVLSEDVAVEIVTVKEEGNDVLELIRHDAAHVMAEAVKELYPETQVTIGPAIEDGFYYDFARDKPFTPEDLEKIEKRMHDIVDRDESIDREDWDRDEAVKFFEDQGEKYKAEIIASIPADQPIGIYKQGEFQDLCRGPHLPSTKKLGHAFKLMKLAGAYWRGDSKNEMLQRVYGTAWRNEKELKAYLNRLEEAERRDHRKLGREMDLFHMQEEAVGMVFWHKHGWTLYRTLENYIRNKLEKANYEEVKTPQLVDRKLWEASGHWDKFRENMYTTESEDKTFALKPMNCPCHVQIFNQGITSYRDLPLRMAEFGSCHRYEPSGALHGIMRVRGFTQDDAHIFCTEDQITSETEVFCELLLDIYKDFGFTEVRVKFSDRPETRAGDDATWDKAEGSLKDAIETTGLSYSMNPGEGAFYGPKLEFVLTDAIGRDWQCGTLQVDFVLPERLNASYIGEDGAKHRPVMLHRAIFGSMERFIGILIEEYAGRFPLDDYAKEVLAEAEKRGLRASLDLRNEKINYKVREHSLAKVPALLVAGKREAEENTISVRRLGEKHQKVMSLTEALDALVQEAHVPGT
jgi:threonyl-tRNA synthetase